MSVFEKAKQYISASIVEQVVNEIDANAIKSGEGWSCRCPFHADKEASMVVHIDEGYFNCLSGCGAKGDFIDLISQFYHMDKKPSAEYIIKLAGGISDSEIPAKKSKKKERVEPVIPIPLTDDIKKKLTSRLKGDWSVTRYGKFVAGWTYKNAEGEPLWVKIRHEKEGRKDVSPYYWGVDNKWHKGHPMPKKRPLYNIHKLSTDVNKLLIVEGEKCADVKVEGYLSLTWDGGTSSVKSSDWSALDNFKGDIVIWPDLDTQKYDRGPKKGQVKPPAEQPGMKAALQIKAMFPGAALLNPYKADKDENYPSGWDIADYAEDGTDPLIFINNCPVHEIRSIKKEVQPPAEDIIFPFQCLGYDELNYVFLQKKVNYPIRFKRGGMNKNHFIELEDLAWWEMMYPNKKGVDWDTVTNDIYRAQQEIGFFDEATLRGAGFWKNGDQIILNTGREIITAESEKINYKDFDTDFNYIFSQRVKMDDWIGDISTPDEGKLLKHLFHAQDFENQLQAYVALGWSLIAPFGGLLEWRPHIWISGSSESGKSWVMENLISPLVGSSALHGSGGSAGSSLAATRRSLGQDVRPVIYDEMEPKNMQAITSISGLVEIARNATSNSSSESRLVNKIGGVDVFRIRSPFCFASVVPFFDDSAARSRFIVCNVSGRNMSDKMERTKTYIEKGILDDPGRYRRRIFSQIHDVIDNIEVLKAAYFRHFTDRRKADMLAPIFSIIYALDHSGPVTDKWIEESKKYLDYDLDISVMKDEDRLFNEIMELPVRISASSTKTVSEMITHDQIEQVSDNKDNLERIGIKLITGRDGIVKIAIAKSSRYLRHELERTPWSHNYASVLKRHDHYLESRSEKMAGKSTDSILLDFSKISYSWSEEVDSDIPF